MRQPVFLFAAIVLLGLSACKNAREEAAQQKAWDEMMVVHDEVMPRMSEINSLGKTIQGALADTSLDVELRAAADKVLDDLVAADKAMWDWMYDLQQLPDLRQNAKHDAIMNYIGEETVKIEAVKTLMLGSIENGKKVAEQLPPAMPPADMPPK